MFSSSGFKEKCVVSNSSVLEEDYISEELDSEDPDEENDG
jgi:hypothetical protein